MTVQQKISFTALPHGVGSRGHQLSVLVSPRLFTNVAPKTLAKWLDFVDWPHTVSGITWSVRFAGHPAPIPAIRTGAAPRSDLWQALFPSSSFVKPYKFDDQLKGFDKLPIISFPSAHVQSFLKDTYLGFAKSTSVPAVQSLLNAFGEIGYIDGRERPTKLHELTKKIEKQLNHSKAIPHGPPDPGSDVAQALLFHTPASKPTPHMDSPYFRVPGPFEPPKLDFHQALSMLGEHPQLMRALGLVVDLVFTRPSGVGPTDTVWVEASWTSAMPAGQNLTVPPTKTRCRISSSRFEAAPRASGPEIDSGLLRLTDKFPDKEPRYELIQVDHDGAAIKMVAFINDLIRSQLKAHKTTDTPAEAAPPNFRSGGLSIVRTERALALHLKFKGIAKANKDLESNNPVLLSREDLTRGFAFDVFDVGSGNWYPLCERTGSAKFTGNGGPIDVPLSEESGWISLAAAQSADGNDDRLRIHESIASWANGWSMVADRPGKTVNRDEQPEYHTPETTDFKLEVTYQAAPGTLPPQRFGRQYRVRARAVDLAGNVTSASEANTTGFKWTLGPERYGRFDPILPPTIVMRKPLSEAESPEFMVIRSNQGTPAGSTVANERHVFPPSIDEFRAEVLGMFDTPSGIDPSAYQEITHRDGGFGDTDGGGNFVNPDAQPDPNNYGSPYYDVDTPQFPVENAQMARMPSLPDPLARGAGFLGLPGTALNEVITHEFGAGVTWPDTLPFRLRIVEGNAAPAFSGGVLTVKLPKAEVAKVRMGSFLFLSDLEQMGLWEWLQFDAGLSAIKLGKLKSKILQGLHWSFTPGRTLTLTHAVRQPLVPTNFADLKLSKTVGETFVILRDTMTTSRKSTERLDVNAEWTEVSDFLDPVTKIWEPTRLTTINALAFQKRIELDPANDGTFRIGDRHELHHTRHVPEVNYSTVATTRFKEYFAERKALDFGGGNTVALDSQWTGPAAGTTGVVPESDVVRSLDGKTTYVRGKDVSDAAADYYMDYPAATITRNASKPGPMPTHVKASYLVPPITEVSPAPTTRRVLSSARPDAPRVLYAVPNFKWDRPPSIGAQISSTRGGGSLRVYMDRPWWSSGADELLGVVVLPAGRSNPSLSEKLRPFVTTRGQDPTWKSSAASLQPQVADFTAKVATGTGLTLDELQGAKVAVAGHQVGHDDERLLWYCDIDISPGSSYFPFIRLALARFQPHSVKTGATDVSLSRVVLLDYIQLAPSRTATVTTDPSDRSSVLVSVSGRSYKAGAAGSGPAGVEVTLEQRRPQMPGSDDNLAWVPATDQPAELAAHSGRGGITVWNGSVALPQPRGTVPYRLAIREYETLVISKPSRGIGLKKTGRRMVYADTIEI